MSLIVAIALAAAAATTKGTEPTAPKLRYVFTIEATLGTPIEEGTVDGRRKRFVPIVGGKVYGPKLSGMVLAGGGDWQTIDADGLTLIDTRYMLQASDGTVIEVLNPGVRVASPEVTAAIARGQPVSPDAYYFRTTPRMSVAAGAHEWLRRTAFVGRGTRNVDNVQIEVFAVE